jgi:hypothetical protein
MKETEYREYLFEALYGQPHTSISEDIKEEVLAEVNSKFQEQVYTSYKKKYPDTGKMDMYLIHLLDQEKPVKNLDYEQLNTILERMGQIKKDLLTKKLETI